MGITLDNSIRLLENYREWEKQHGLDGNGVDDATNKLVEVAKKYQKIQEIVAKWENEMHSGVSCSFDRMGDIKEVIEDENDN